MFHLIIHKNFYSDLHIPFPYFTNFCLLLFVSIFLVLEKEIVLLKQVQTLNTTEENTRMMRLVDSIQLKLDQKTKKIKELKNNEICLKKEIETLTKVNF